MILDEKDSFTKDALFRAEWAARYPNLEWIGRSDGGTLRAVEGLQAKCEIEVDGRFTPYTHVCLEQEMGRA